MAKPVEFVPECWADTSLMEALLGIPDGRLLINHGQGIGDVCRILRDDDELRRGRYVVGMVDNDRKFFQHRYLSEFTYKVVGRCERENMCKEDVHCVMQHPTRPEQFIIVLNPACDTWLFRAAQQAGISLEALGIPSDFAGFKQVSKRNGIFPNPRMDALMKLLVIARPPMFQELANFVAQVMRLALPRPVLKTKPQI